MNLTHLVLHNFRNIPSAQIHPDVGFNILYGDNAQGKSNTLEAIYLLTNLKSFRRGRNEEFIGPAAKHANIKGTFVAKQVENTLNLAVSHDQKVLQIDGKRPQSGNDLFGRFPSVLFAPEEVNLVKGFPTGRRALLDRALCQTRPAYLGLARAYQRCLRQRNLLLKSAAATATLEPWTEELVKTGAEVRLARRLYLDRLLPLLRQAYAEICAGRETVDLAYPVETDSLDGIQQDLRNSLQREEGREHRYGMTLAGPHRDDPVFLVNGRSLGLYGSQGQQRSFMLAFKTAQILDLENKTGVIPLLLLDDMTSELDRKRQGFFFRFLHERKGQVFITCTELAPLYEAGFSDMRVFRVREGTIGDS